MLLWNKGEIIFILQPHMSLYDFVWSEDLQFKRGLSTENDNGTIYNLKKSAL